MAKIDQELVSLFAPLFPVAIKERGMDIYSKRKVTIVESDDVGYIAIVPGQELYTVELRNEGSVWQRLKCTCPYSADHDFCKHMWALILTVARGGTALPKSPDAGPPPVIRTTPRPNWQPILQDAIREEEHPYAYGGPSEFGDHLIYFLHTPYSQTSQVAQVELFFRDRKRNGEWTVPKYVRLRRHDVDRLPREEDREILAEVVVQLPEGSAWGSYSQSDFVKNTQYLGGLRMPVLLERMAATGRLWYGNQLQKDTWQPLTFSPLSASITIEIAEQGQDWLRGKFAIYAGDQQLDKSKVFILDQRVLWSGNTLYRLEHPGSPAWLREAFSKNGIQVPRSDWADFFGTISSLTRKPVLKLPPSLQPIETRGTPRPRLRIRFKPSDSKAEATLSFAYPDGIEVPDSVQRIALSDDARHILHLDTAAHETARQHLREAGLQPFQEPESNEPLWALPIAKFAPAVRSLLERQWIVEAEGRPVRVSTATRLRVSSGIDWFDIDAAAEYDEGMLASLPEILAAIQNKSRFLRLGDGSIGLLPEEWVQRYAPLARLAKVEGNLLRLRKQQGPLLDALLAEREDVFTDEAFEQMRTRLRAFKGITPAPQPPGFVGQMRPYQLEGLAWLQFLEEYGLGGCLADDMGVGKTIQFLAHLENRRTRRESGEALPPDLVVVPKSLLFNWVAESNRFTPGLRILDYTGTARDRKEIAHHDLAITTYGTLRRDIAALSKMEFGTVVLDEAQAIKNASSDSSKAVRLLNSRHRLAMTGTPVENHLGELWSLFEFLNPGLLGPGALWKPGAALEVETRDWLRRSLRPLILRRTKQQVASDLPARNEQVLYCDLEPDQRKIYAALLLKVRKDLDDRIAAEGLAKSKLHVFEALLRLRQAACHPRLIQENSPAESAKFEVLLDQLAEIIDEGHKALVFSQFTSLLALLQKELQQRSMSYEYLDGQTRDRQERVEHFQNDPACSLFLLSLKAGGTGLNLTAADYVFLLDPWWNPAVEAQAIDRTHRIGQTRPVFAYRLVARNTIEERILELQQSKRDLAEAVLSEDNATLATLKREDLDYLLS